MPALLGVGNAQYGVISTNGTTTLNSGPASGVASQPGAFYGAALLALGTAPTLNVVDIVGTSTFQLMTASGTAAGQTFAAGPNIGVRYRGALVVISAGTAAGTWNALWD
jgi:hypothetical protein